MLPSEVHTVVLAKQLVMPSLEEEQKIQEELCRTGFPPRIQSPTARRAPLGAVVLEDHSAAAAGVRVHCYTQYVVKHTKSASHDTNRWLLPSDLRRLVGERAVVVKKTRAQRSGKNWEGALELECLEEKIGTV